MHPNVCVANVPIRIGGRVIAENITKLPVKIEKTTTPPQMWQPFGAIAESW